MPTSSKHTAGWLVLVFGLILISIPFVAIFLTDSLHQQLERVRTGLPVGILSSMAGCLLVVGAVCVWLFVRMRLASIPIVSLILFGAFWISTVVASAAVYKYRQTAPQDTEATQLLISGGVDGLKVTCNGVELGVTPIKMSLEEFRRLVPPADGPPDQPSAKVSQISGQGYRHRTAGWTMIPSRFPGESVLSHHTFSDPEHVILGELSNAEYWWSFQGRKVAGRMNEISWSQSNEWWRVSEVQWPDMKTHVALLALLGEEEGVDPRVAYADHIREYSPPLDSLLEKHFDRLAEGQGRSATAEIATDSEQLQVDQSSPLSFNEAVYRNDLATIVRSNDPRATPLIRRHLDQLQTRYRSPSSVMTFGSKDLLLMTESPSQEVAEMLKDILKHADWTDTGLVEKFVLQQIRHGADRQSLQEWLKALTFEAGFGQPIKARLIVKLGAENFSSGAKGVGYGDLLNAIEHFPSDEIRPSVIKWLVNEWSVAPAGNYEMMPSTNSVLKAMVAHSGQETIQQAWRDTSLRHLKTVKGFTQALQLVQTWEDHTAVADILVDVIARELTASGMKSDALNREFAQQLHTLKTPRAIQALEDASKQHQLEDSVFEKVLIQCRREVASDKKRRQSNLQLARELVAGSKKPQDLIETTDFVWRNGRYEPVENADSVQ